jgi:hypothetical protein
MSEPGRPDPDCAGARDEASLNVYAGWMTSPSSPAPEQASARQQWLEIALIFLVFFTVAGEPAPAVNEPHYLSKAKHYWNPEWCEGDLFLESADAHLTFYWTLGILTRWFSLPTVAWIGRTVAWLALAWSWQRLSSRVVPMRWASVITSLLMLWLIAKCNFAGEWIVGGIEGKCFAYAFVIWGLSELAVGNWRFVWPLLGLAAAFHVLVGGWSVIAAAGVWILEPRATRPTLVKMVPSLLLGGVLALLGVFPGLLLTANVPPEVAAKANRIYVFDRLPHHLAPLQLPAEELSRRIQRFGILILAFAWLSWYRAQYEAANNALLRIQNWALLSLAISLSGMAWELVTLNQPGLSASVLKYYWFRLADIAVPLAVALSLGAVLKSALQNQQRLAAIISAVTMATACFWLITTSTTRYAESTDINTYAAIHDYGWREACHWANENTTPDSLFMVPRRSYDFRWYAQRPVFFTWKDVPQDAVSLNKWWKRYQDAYYGAVDLFGNVGPYYSPQDMGAERLRETAAEYNIDYLLTGEYPPLPLPVVYENPWYKIYSFKPLAEKPDDEN